MSNKTVISELAVSPRNRYYEPECRADQDKIVEPFSDFSESGF